MSKKLFVGSLSWDTNDEGLRNAFAVHGEVSEAVVISDRDTGRSRGFGFVTFEDEEAADKAVAALKGSKLGKDALFTLPWYVIIGPPGVGKSDMIRQTGERHAAPVIDIRLSQMEPSDLRGIPFRVDGRVDWAVPSMLPNAERHGEQGILFLDEITSVPPSVSAAAYQLILDRRLGEYQVPDGWAIFAAGNRQGDRGVTYAAAPPAGAELVEGAWWPEDYSGPPLVSFSAEHAATCAWWCCTTITGSPDRRAHRVEA